MAPAGSTRRIKTSNSSPIRIVARGSTVEAHDSSGMRTTISCPLCTRCIPYWATRVTVPRTTSPGARANSLMAIRVPRHRCWLSLEANSIDDRQRRKIVTIGISGLIELQEISRVNNDSIGIRGVRHRKLSQRLGIDQRNDDPVPIARTCIGIPDHIGEALGEMDSRRMGRTRADIAIGIIYNTNTSRDEVPT